MTREDSINALIQSVNADTNSISDSYHTFGELYEHRIILYIALCKSLWFFEKEYTRHPAYSVWRSIKHSDGSEWDGWFILGINSDKENQITYHLPISKWSDCDFAKTLDKAPDWDGHTSEDVLKRLKELI